MSVDAHACMHIADSRQRHARTQIIASPIVTPTPPSAVTTTVPLSAATMVSGQKILKETRKKNHKKNTQMGEKEQNWGRIDPYVPQSKCPSEQGEFIFGHSPVVTILVKRRGNSLSYAPPRRNGCQRFLLDNGNNNHCVTQST